MSDVWRICVVESDPSLNQNLVNALRKDGYVVQGVIKGADAIRVLWSEEYNVVICDLNLSDGSGFELLRWLRTYRSNVCPVVLGDASRTADSGQRLQALESGAISYIEKPVDLRLLKDELRRLLQQTGFTASLDSFDLLDVIQMITMSRKSITLLINIGLEERGALRFHNGDLAWAEYGVLRGEEAFFALAAHKNGTVTQQVSNEPLVTNVTQPLSRLIFQALQYRTKYANTQQPVGGSPGQEEVGQGQVGQGQTQSLRVMADEIDDSPFVFTSEGMVSSDLGSVQQMPQATSAFSALQGLHPPVTQMDLYARHEAMNTSQSSPLQGETSTTEKDSSQMSSWLSDQPTSAQAPIRTPTHFSSVEQGPVPPTSLSGEMQQIQPSAQMPLRTTDPLQGSQQSAPQMRAFAAETEERRISSSQRLQEQKRPSSSPMHRPAGESGVFERTQGRQNPPDTLRENKPMQAATPPPQTQRQVTGENHAAMVSALQTLGYSIPGFIAAAVIDVDSHPLAQVAIDDTDSSQVWQLLSLVQRSVLNALQSDEWGKYEETIMTTASRQVLMRAISSDKKAFLVLITTRETNFTQSLEIITDVEGAVTAALR